MGAVSSFLGLKRESAADISRLFIQSSIPFLTKQLIDTEIERTRTGMLLRQVRRRLPRSLYSTSVNCAKDSHKRQPVCLGVRMLNEPLGRESSCFHISWRTLDISSNQQKIASYNDGQTALIHLRHLVAQERQMCFVIYQFVLARVIE